MNWRRGIARIVRLYTTHTPIARGKGLLLRMTQGVLKNAGTVAATSQYGTSFELRFPEDHGWECIEILGDYETGTSRLLQSVVRPGEVVFDVGANIGWYSTLLGRVVGEGGEVHSFEPVPWIYAKLAANCRLSGVGGRVRLNQVAVGSEAGRVELFTRAGGPHGETSTFRPSDVASSVVVHVTTLDDYVRQSGRSPALVKVDVEGFENAVVQGSSLLMNQKPMWLFEANFETAAAAGWAPAELLQQLAAAGYRFLRIPRGWREPRRMLEIAECGHGDNVFCYMPERHGERVAQWFDGMA